MTKFYSVFNRLYNYETFAKKEVDELISTGAGPALKGLCSLLLPLSRLSLQVLVSLTFCDTLKNTY